MLTERQRYNETSKRFARLERKLSRIWDSAEYESRFQEWLAMDDELEAYEAGDFHTFDLLNPII